MEPVLILWLLLALAFAGFVLYVIRVVRDDDRGHAYTHRPAPRSHHDDATTWPWRAA